MELAYCILKYSGKQKKRVSILCLFPILSIFGGDTHFPILAVRVWRRSNILEEIKDSYVQQPLDYGRNSRYGDDWRISCYMVVMENWKPKIMPHEPMLRCGWPWLAMSHPTIQPQF